MTDSNAVKPCFHTVFPGRFTPNSFPPFHPSTHTGSLSKATSVRCLCKRLMWIKETENIGPGTGQLHHQHPPTPQPHPTTTGSAAYAPHYSSLVPETPSRFLHTHTHTPNGEATHDLSSTVIIYEGYYHMTSTSCHL